MEFEESFKASTHFKSQLFQFVQRFNHLAWLDSHAPSNLNFGIELLVAFGKVDDTNESKDSFKELSNFLQQPKWAFGFLSYDLKNEIEPSLKSENHDGLHFPSLYFFQPEVVIKVQDGKVKVSSFNRQLLGEILALNELTSAPFVPQNRSNLQVQTRTPKELYIQKVQEIIAHIARGNIYEMNFCHEFYANQAAIDPYQLYEQLVAFSPTPFASFVRVNDHYILCASPERFLKKEGNKLLSQPIKGTIRRGESKEEDEELAKQLRNSPKDRSENIMIVDLVRNDLSQVALDGSVTVDELCGIYSFPQVHQMISTVSCQVDKRLDSSEIIKSCFPMGSMTGAPKLRAMELIEQFEDAKRGLFSGSIGYFDPDGNFDFNVVIRSILYEKSKQYLSFSVGGAITINSNPIEEYEETLLKAKAILKVLKQEKD